MITKKDKKTKINHKKTSSIPKRKIEIGLNQKTKRITKIINLEYFFSVEEIDVKYGITKSKKINL